MYDWARFIAAVVALAIGAVVIVAEIRDCAATGGVLVESACVRKP